MSKKIQQLKPCPECGKEEGWWSSLQRHSMVFHNAEGEKTEHRLYEAKRKQCAHCNADITDCVG